MLLLLLNDDGLPSEARPWSAATVAATQGSCAGLAQEGGFKGDRQERDIDDEGRRRKVLSVRRE